MKRLIPHPVRGGFTLVELVIVMVIVGSVAAIAIPRFANATSRQKLEAAADRLIADLDLASERARAATETVNVTFSLSNDRYVFNNVGGEAMIIELGEAPYGVDITSAKFADTQIAQFDGYGNPVNAGSVVLTNGRDSITVTLNESGEATR